MKSFGLVFVILLTAPSFVFSGRIPPIPAGHRAQYLLIRPDGGYSAGYDTGVGHTSIAEGDAVNEVRGEYTGGPLRVTYTAGVRGYIPTVEVVDPPTPVFTYTSNPALAYPQTPVYAYPSPPQQPRYIPPPPQQPRYIPPPPQQPRYLPPPPPPQRPRLPIETADARVLVNPDGSYAFAYRTVDQSREESADAHNNVQGSFSFVPPDDGIRRTVNYHAGAATGFVAEGAHLPTPPPPVPPTVPVTDPTPPTADTDEPEPRTEEIGTTPSTEDATVTANQDASYAFAYKTPDQERAEISDSAGNVKGLFSFVAPDGVRRQVDYEAGANKGFIAKGAHLPTPPSTDTIRDTTDPPIEYRTPAIPPPPPAAPAQTANANPPQVNTRSWNAAGWPVTVPDPLRVDSNVGGQVVRNYLPPHPVKAGYVLDNQ